MNVFCDTINRDKCEGSKVILHRSSNFLNSSSPWYHCQCKQELYSTPQAREIGCNSSVPCTVSVLEFLFDLVIQLFRRSKTCLAIFLLALKYIFFKMCL